MTNYIIVDTPGGDIWVEIDEKMDTSGIILVSVKDSASRSFKTAIEAMIGNVKLLLQKAQELSPEEIEVSFGLSIGAEAGLPIFGLAKANGEANYSITLKWKSD